MTTLIHMDTEQVRNVARQIILMGDHLDTKAGGLRTLLRRADWEGPSHDRFMADSVQLFDQLGRHAGASMFLAQRLLREADEWERIDAEGAGRIEEDGSILLTIGASIALLIGIGMIIATPVKAPTIQGEKVIGKGDTLNKYYEPQTGGTCGFQATQNILKAFDKHPTLEELKRSAGYDADKEGTQYEDYREMFEANDVKVDSYESFSSDEEAIESMRQDIEDGKAVLARVNVGPLDYWGGQSGGHAIWVTGIRTDDQGNITHVICNDSGFSNDNYINDTWDGTSMEVGSDGEPDGMGIEYPIDEFLDAWERKEYSYIATQDPMPTI